MKFINKISYKKIEETVKKYLNNNVLFLTFVIASLTNASLVRFITVRNYFDLRPMLSDLSIVVLLGAFGYFFKPKNQFKYYLTVSILLVLICIINSMYYTNYMSFASFSLLATSTQVVDVADAVVNNVMEPRDFTYLWQLLALFSVNSFLKRRNYYSRVKETEKGKISFFKTAIVAASIFIIFTFTLASSDWSKFVKQWNREFVVMKFGLYLYQGNDLVSSLKPQISPLFGYDNAVKNYRDFYSSRTNNIVPNEYTNIFKGKNVIFIHAESIQNFVINKEFNNVPVTPFLNKLSKEGLYFSNFYAQESIGTSSDTEFTLNTSLLPVSNGTVFINYWNRNYVTMPKLLKEQNYYAFSMHGNKGNFWNRSVMHPKLGYDEFYYLDKYFTLDEKIGLGLSDKSFFKQAIPKIKEINDSYQNFYATMIMLTNHTPFVGIEGLSDYKVDDYLEGTVLGSYFKSVHYADSAIEQFLDDLDKEGILDNTVIVIYGDHDNKIKRKEYLKYFNYDKKTGKYLNPGDKGYYDFNYYEYELNRKVPFIIWSKDKKLSTEVTKVMGMYDVLPTIGNMFGFNDYYALGHDIFSVDENVVVFPDGNWLTNKVYYDSQKEATYQLGKEAVSTNYIEKNNKYAEELVTISNDIIIYDLINKVGDITNTEVR